MIRLTLDISDDLKQQLDDLSGRQHRRTEDLAREMLERNVAVARFRELRGRSLEALGPDASATDDDVFNKVS